MGGEDSFNGYEEDLVDQILYNSKITWLNINYLKLEHLFLV